LASELNWHPIDAAPRDGRYVLLANRWQAVHIGFYDVTRPRGRRWCVEGFGDSHDDFFTHWMPLPAPPVRTDLPGSATGTPASPDQNLLLAPK